MHYGQQQRQKQDRPRRRRERDRLRRQMETVEEREEGRSINLSINICDVDSYIKTLLNRLARCREYDRCRHAAIAMMPEQHQQQRERHQALNEQSRNDALSRRSWRVID